MISRLFLLLITTAALAGNTIACSIPVFRYALDRWTADPFILQVPEADRAAWEAALATRPVDLTVQPDATATAGKILFPESRGSKVLLEPVTVADLPGIVTSKARQEVVRRIVSGDSAVFVFLGSGSEEDATALKMIEERLKYLVTVRGLPEQDQADPASVVGPGPALKVAFSVLKLDRNDPDEKPFINMLMAGLEAQEREAGKPVAFPIFGRGRVLAGLTGESLKTAVIDDACQFLLGACSCQVKEMNPGWDLLIEADWDNALQLAEKARSAQPQPPEQTPTPAATPETVILSGTKPVPTTAISATPQAPFAISRRLAFAFGSISLVGVLVFLVRRK